MPDHEEIEQKDIRTGDRIRFEVETPVEPGSLTAGEYIAETDGHSWLPEGVEAKLYLLERALTFVEGMLAADGQKSLYMYRPSKAPNSNEPWQRLSVGEAARPPKRAGWYQHESDLKRRILNADDRMQIVFDPSL